VAQAIEHSNATQLYGCMMDADTRAKQMRLDWDDFKVRDTRVHQVLYSTAAPRVCSGRVFLSYVHCTVHTHCKEAHHSEPPLCDCDAESKPTPICDTTTQPIPSPAERIRRRTVKATSQVCALLGAHRTHLTKGYWYSYHYWTRALPAGGIKRKIA